MSYGMGHRSYGETRDCKGCRFWSEMIAQSVGGGPVQAMCLASKPAQLSGQYTSARQKCDAWASGHYGAIDEPGEDNLALYAEDA